EARVPERLHPRDHGAGTPVRPAPGRGHHHRDGLRLARRRHPHRGVDPQPGLPGRAVRRDPAGARHRVGEPDRRSDRGVDRPPHTSRRMTALSAEERSLASVPALPDAVVRARRAGWQRLLRLRWGLAAAVILVLSVTGAALAPWIAPRDPLIVNVRHRLAPPAWMEGGSRENLLGTDQVGRDLLSRVIYGGRVSLVVGVAAVLLSTTIGVLL